MTVPTNLKFTLNAPFPSLVTGSGPVTVGKQNGIWTVGFNTANLAVQNPPPPTSLATDYVLVYDSVAKQFINVPLSNFTPMVLLNVLTANNSTQLDDTTSITGAYQDYVIVFENILPDTNAVHFGMRLRITGVFQATNYLNSAAAATSFVDLTQAANLPTTAAWGYCGMVRLFNANSTTSTKMVNGVAGYLNSGGTISAVQVAGAYSISPDPVTGMRFFTTPGTMTSGRIKIYGTV